MANLTLVKSTFNSLEINWSLPRGLVDYFIISCLISNAYANNLRVENTTTSFRFENLLSSQFYEISVWSVKGIESTENGNNDLKVQVKSIYKTKSVLSQCLTSECKELEIISQTDFSQLNDLQLVETILRVSSLVNNDQIKQEYYNMINLIGYTSDILMSISMRNTSEESFYVVVSFMALIDSFLGKPKDLLRVSESLYKSSTK